MDGWVGTWADGWVLIWVDGWVLVWVDGRVGWINFRKSDGSNDCRVRRCKRSWKDEMSGKENERMDGRVDK